MSVAPSPDIGPRTPPGSPTAKTAKPSPAKINDKYHVPENREQYQKFGYDKHLLKGALNEEEFLGYLNVDVQDLARSLDTKEMEGFYELANAVAKAIKDRHFPKRDTLVFQDTGEKAPPGHVTDTKCKPDITAAFEGHWENGIVRWPFIRLAGEVASKGKTSEDQEIQAISYLHYLLLARPDLYVAQGLLASDATVTFLFGIGGQGIWKFNVEWAHKDLVEFLCAFIYRLYEPGDFADETYIKTEFHENSRAKYTIKTTFPGGAQECPGFYSIHAKHPFGTRTHVLSNPDFKPEGNLGNDLTIIKEQFCRVGRCFQELNILTEHIHKPQRVPGVVVAAYDETITSRHLSKPEERCKHRLGLGESGSPFTSIRTLQEVLETLFDVLEVLRYLRLYRKVLHRDISSGNVLYVEESSNRPLPPNCVSVPSVEEARTNGFPLCYAKYLLEKSDNPLETSMLLVDFNLAEHLGSETSVTQIYRTGTPIFIARAVEQDEPVPAFYAPVPGIPESPARYAEFHPDRVNKFPSSVKKIPFNPKKWGSDKSQKLQRKPWRHELQHDAESVFWLLLYWAMGVQPEGGDKQEIDATSWMALIGNFKGRENFMIILALGTMPNNLTHSFYQPLHHLIKDLAAILVIDGHHLEASDPRKDTYYVTEAFQRLILNFILDNKNEEFMRHRVEKTFRNVEEVLRSNAKPATDSQAEDSLY